MADRFIFLTTSLKNMFRYPILSLTVILLIIGCSTSADPEEINYKACENGFSDGFPCDNIELYAHVNAAEMGGNGARLNDIWGWIDPETGREYALVGLTDGVSIVEVTDPANPVVLAKLLESTSRQTSVQDPLMAHHDDEGGFKEASSWRDMKVYENYLYVVSEQDGHGLQVFDLTRIRDVREPPEEFREDYLYSRFGKAHNLAINEETGYAYVVGSTSGEICAEEGGLHIVNLHENPLEPSYAGCHTEPEAGGSNGDGYVHDTQCVIYSGPDDRFAGRELCFSAAEKTFLISDVSDKNQPETVSNSSYSGVQYSHQGWLSEDQRYFFMNDELDELRTGANTKTYVWDLQNLEKPELIGIYEHSTGSVDHNLYVKNDRLFQANYTSGLRVLDISSPMPDQITTIGYFDTTPNDDRPSFAGLWSVYPYLSGDKVIVSDINNGLFILRYSR